MPTSPPNAAASDVRLDLHDGHPRLTVDGRSLLPLIYSTSVLRANQIKLFRNVGVDIVSFPCTADFHLYHLAADVWKGPDDYDYTELDARLDLVMQAHPEAWLLPRVFTCSPPWWDAAHRDDLVVWDDGATKRPLFHGAAKFEVPSLASDRWRTAMEENVRRLIRHVENGHHGDRVLGYMINSENSEEWFHWGTMEGYGFDDNAQMTRRFRTWLERRYVADEGLANAWRRRDARIAEATLPDHDRRLRVGGLACRNPKTDQDVVDYRLFFADLIAETIGDLAAAVKDETNARKLFGTFYGYLVELVYHPDGVQSGGHLALDRVLNDKNVDFLASPSSYARRLPACGYSMSMVPSSTVNRHGKVFFHENDYRTHVLFDDAGYGRCDTAAETSGLQRRELAHALTHGHGLWWFDMTSGWYDDPVLRETITRLVKISREAASRPREGVAEMAVVLDPASMLWVGAPPNQFVQLVVQQMLELSRVAAPFDVVLLDDLLDRGLGRYRFVLFPTSFHVDESCRAALHDMLHDSDVTALWLVAPGFVDDDVDPAHAEKLVGFPVTLPPHPRFAVAESTDGTHSGTWFWHGYLPEPIPDATTNIRARYVDDDRPAVITKRMDGWTSAYSGVPALAGSELRDLARRAGVHLYLDTDDAVYACNRFVAIHARNAGRRALHLPDTDVVFDVVHDVEKTARDDVFDIYLPRGETALFFRGSQAEWLRE